MWLRPFLPTDKIYAICLMNWNHNYVSGVLNLYINTQLHPCAWKKKKKNILERKYFITILSHQRWHHCPMVHVLDWLTHLYIVLTLIDIVSSRLSACPFSVIQSSENTLNKWTGPRWLPGKMVKTLIELCVFTAHSIPDVVPHSCWCQTWRFVPVYSDKQESDLCLR